VPSESAQTISAAMATCGEGDTVVVEDGVYKESVMLSPGVVLKARTLHGAEIRGRGRDPAITMATNSQLVGVTVKGGAIGIVSRGRGNRIARCQVTNNDRTGIMCVGQLPAIEDNVIAFNRGSGVQGRDVRSGEGWVRHNTIVYNQGHGISIGGSSSIVAEYNIVAFNGKADLFTDSEAAQCDLRNNNLFRNGRSVPSLSNGNISVDPQFVGPRKMDFRLKEGSPCIRAADESSDLGARLRE
jgi:hypothetical protein